MADHRKDSKSPASAAARQQRNEVLRTEGRPPETPSTGYRFIESVCLTPLCGAVVRYEISTAAPWHLNNDHAVCDRCAATYKLAVERVDADVARVTFRNAEDRQS